MVSYQDYMGQIFDILAELGYFNADMNHKTDAEVERVRKEMDLYCQKNGISIKDYMVRIVNRVVNKRRSGGWSKKHQYPEPSNFSNPADDEGFERFVKSDPEKTSFHFPPPY